jgi:hypothetical protein
VKLFCQGTASVRQWKRIRDTRDNLSLSRIKACATHFDICGLSVLPITFSNLSINSIPIPEYASPFVSFPKDFLIIHVCPAHNTVKIYTMILINIDLFVRNVTLMDNIENYISYT